MSKPLTDLMPTLYAALDTVSRELVGFIPAVTTNAAPATAALGETIRVPSVGAAEAEDIRPGVATDKGQPDVDYIDMKIEKSRMVPVRWSGEEQHGASNTGSYNAILAAQFAQAMRTLVNEVERDLAGLYVHASHAHGTPGTPPFADSLMDASMVRKLLADNGAPLTDMQLVVDTSAGARLRANNNLVRAVDAGTDLTLRRGVLLDVAGLAIRESAQIRRHEAGILTSTAQVNNPGGYAAKSTIVAVDGVADMTLKAGDVLNFGDHAVGHVLSAAATVTPLTLGRPGLVQTVADDCPVTLCASYMPNMAFARGALHLLARTPAMPDGGDGADDVTLITDPLSGLSFQVAVYRGYRQVRYEVGLAWGVKNVKPEHTVLLLG